MNEVMEGECNYQKSLDPAFKNGNKQNSRKAKEASVTAETESGIIRFVFTAEGEQSDGEVNTNYSHDAEGNSTFQINHAGRAAKLYFVVASN